MAMSEIPPPEATPPAATPPQAPRKTSPVRIILMLALGGPVLAFGGCALFLANLNIEGHGSGSDSLSAVGAIIFIAGCLGFVVGILWAIARWINRRFDKAKASTAATSTTRTDSTSTPSTDTDGKD
jgi:hypothetical protein